MLAPVHSLVYMLQSTHAATAVTYTHAIVGLSTLSTVEPKI